MPTAAGMYDFPVEDDKNYQALLKGRIDVTRQTDLVLEAEKSQTQRGTEFNQPHRCRR